jgi:Protein of unknown function (DUF1566)
MNTGCKTATRRVLCLCAIWVGPATAQQVCDTTRHALSSPTSRFEDHGDGTVTDKFSGLMWMRCSEGQQWLNGHCSGPAQQQSWATAQTRAAAVNKAGSHFYNDWRVPSLRELGGITERQCASPRLNLSVFPSTPAQAYWTATSRAQVAADSTVDAFAFVIGFDASGIHLQNKEDMRAVRLVRHAQ